MKSFDCQCVATSHPMAAQAGVASISPCRRQNRRAVLTSAPTRRWFLIQATIFSMDISSSILAALTHQTVLELTVLRWRSRDRRTVARPILLLLFLLFREVRTTSTTNQ